MSAPTQTRHPWRATIRTTFAVVVALAAMLPALVAASGVDETLAPVAGALAIAGAITRVMALPAVDAFLSRFVPWLAAGADDDSPMLMAPLMATGDAAVTANVSCPNRRCGERFEIPITSALWGVVSAIDTGCIEVTRPSSPAIDNHIAAHRAAGEWPAVEGGGDRG